MKKVLLSFILVIMIVLVSACKSDTSETSDANLNTEIPPVEKNLNETKDGEEQVDVKEVEDDDKVEEPETISVNLTLYFPDIEGNFLHPETRTVEISVDEQIEYVVLRELFKGPDSEELAPSLAGDDMINAIVVNDGGDCVIDFKSEFLILNTGGSSQESFVIGSIVNSLCELDFINTVAFTVEGEGNVEFGHTILDYAMEPMPELVKE